MLSRYNSTLMYLCLLRLYSVQVWGVQATCTDIQATCKLPLQFSLFHYFSDKKLANKQRDHRIFVTLVNGSLLDPQLEQTFCFSKISKFASSSIPTERKNRLGF